MPKQPLSKQEYPGLLISAARRRVRQVVTALAKPYDLSSQQFWVLVAVRSHPGLSLTELGERQRLDQPTASRIVDALSRRRLIRVEGDPQDRRRMRIWLTATGAPLAARLLVLAEEHRTAVVDGMTDRDLEQLRNGLLRVVENLDRFHARILERTHGDPPKRAAKKPAVRR